MRFVCFAFVILSGFAFVRAADVSKHELQRDDAFWVDKRHNVMKYLGPALEAAGRVARINYETNCTEPPTGFLALPSVKVQKPSADKHGFAAIRDVLQNDRRVTATQDRSGMIRITIGNPATEILKTKIRVLKFDVSEQYTPLLATGALINCKEVDSAAEKLGLEFPVIATSIGVVPPEPERPHLPSALRNITFDEVLDRIARTFRCVSVYGYCKAPGPHHYWWAYVIDYDEPGRGW